MLTTDGFSRSAMSAKLIAPAPGVSTGARDAIVRAALGVRADVGTSAPATMTPTRKADTAVRQTVTRAKRRLIDRL